MKPDYTVTEGRPASRWDPDPLFTEEEQTEIRRRHDEAATAERNVWLGLALLVVVFAVLGAVALVLIASAPRGAAHRGVSTRATAVHVRFEPLLGAPSKGSPFEDTGAPQARLSGWATFYDVAAGHAAAGPLLQTGDWRGRAVTVCAGKRCIVTRLTDACACASRNGRPTLIDLARGDFARLAPPSAGVVLVTIGRATLPATDRE